MRKVKSDERTYVPNVRVRQQLHGADGAEGGQGLAATIGITGGCGNPVYVRRTAEEVVSVAVQGAARRTKMEKQKLYRQGDVMFKTIDALPRGKRKRRNGVVAYGEVTGHAHAVMSEDTAEVIEISGDLYLRVNERGLSVEGDVARVLPDVRRIAGDTTEHPLRRQSAVNLLAELPTAGAIFLHGTEAERAARPVPTRDEDRHLPTALAPGEYEVPIQREYTPTEIRNVAD